MNLQMFLHLTLGLVLVNLIGAELKQSECWNKHKGVCTGSSRCPSNFSRAKGNGLCNQNEKCCIADFNLQTRDFDSKICGLNVLNATSRLSIINGVTAEPYQFPWLVSLATDGKHFCGGSILNEKWVVTAAHCLVDIRPAEIQVRAGIVWSFETALTHNKYFQISRAKSTKIHLKYKQPVLVNDIGVIELETPFKYTDAVRPVCLPKPETNTPTEASILRPETDYIIHVQDNIIKKEFTRPNSYSDSLVFTVAGFGKTQTLKTSTSLQTVNLPGMPLTMCALMNEDIFESSICTGFKEGGRDACQGDSGGPVTTFIHDRKNKERAVLFGIVSWGNGCAAPKSPGVNTRLSYYLDWIDYTTRVPFTYSDSRYSNAKTFVYRSPAAI